MKLSEFKKLIENLNEITFELENGTLVPSHFHITEVGQITKHFIDCGGVIRNEITVNFQLWHANDFSHRLTASKMMDIIKLSEDKLNIVDAEIEVEYQNETIGKFDLAFNGNHFVLKNTTTACLAPDACGVDGSPKQKISLKDLNTNQNNTCTPGSGCC